MYKRIGLTLFLFLLVVAGNAQNKKGKLYGVAFYNLENLFDTVRTIMNTCLTGGTSGMKRNISRSWNTCRRY